MCSVSRLYVCLVLYLFDGEVVDQVVVVFIEAAVQRDTVGVKEQVLRKNTEKGAKNKSQSNQITFQVVCKPKLSLNGINKNLNNKYKSWGIFFFLYC